MDSRPHTSHTISSSQYLGGVTGKGHEWPESVSKQNFEFFSLFFFKVGVIPILLLV